jgi:hypothetical protein
VHTRAIATTDEERKGVHENTAKQLDDLILKVNEIQELIATSTHELPKYQHFHRRRQRQRQQHLTLSLSLSLSDASRATGMT